MQKKLQRDIQYLNLIQLITQIKVEKYYSIHDPDFPLFKCVRGSGLNQD